jgi:HD-like signal output (HDOD) protein
MQEIVMLIRLDPSISARVLRVGNSAYYSQGVRCFTVEEAVHRVGYGEIYELVSYAVASQVLVRPLEVYGVEADELWKQSVACALAAEMLAERTGQDRDVAYTVGLLHVLGMVAIDEWALRQQPGLLLRRGAWPREATEAEREALGFTQADVGAALLNEWDFPRSMSEPVRWQYAPRSSAGHAKMACLLNCAKWLRSAACAGADDPRPPLPADPALQALGIEPAQLVGMVRGVQERLREVSSLLDVAADAPQEMRRYFPAFGWGGDE